MATAYISNRFPVGFSPKQEGAVQNGSLALASTFYNIADNQHWLVMGDTELVNFHAGFDWNGAPAKVVRVLVPPFAMYAGFHFFVGRDFNATPGGGGTPTTSGNGITISCGVSTRKINNIPFGEDRTATLKPSLTYGAYGWVHADMIAPNPQSGDQGALQLLSAPSETWTTVDVTVTLDEYVWCRAAAYNILPNRAGYTVST